MVPARDDVKIFHLNVVVSVARAGDRLQPCTTMADYRLVINQVHDTGDLSIRLEYILSIFHVHFHPACGMPRLGMHTR